MYSPVLLRLISGSQDHAKVGIVCVGDPGLGPVQHVVSILVEHSSTGGGACMYESWNRNRKVNVSVGMGY